MTEYCSATDVSNRITAGGYLDQADADGDSALDASEVAASMTTVIEYAGGFIDSHIQKRISTTSARASGNTWLRDRAIDIASYRFVTNGGREGVDAFQTDFETTKELLERVRDDGDDIPGLTLEPAVFTDGPVGPFEIRSEWSP